MELDKLLEELLDEKLYQIVLSNAKNPEKVSKVKIRPVMLQKTLYFQRTSYIGTKVFHENLDKQSVINEIIAFLEQDFKQMTLENMIANATVLVSKKGKMTIKRTDKKVQNNAMDKPVLAHNRKKSYLLEEGVPVPFLIDLGVQTKGRLFMPSMINSGRLIDIWKSLMTFYLLYQKKELSEYWTLDVGNPI